MHCSMPLCVGMSIGRIYCKCFVVVVILVGVYELVSGVCVCVSDVYICIYTCMGLCECVSDVYIYILVSACVSV